LRLYYADEVGFAPTLPTGSSWCLPGERKLVAHESPQGRRVNALAAYRPYGPRPRLDWWAAARTWTSADLIAFLQELPWSAVPRVVVLDNAGLHTSRAVKAARPVLAKLGIYLYYLPAYSPELNEIEGVFRQVKYQEMPQRSYASKGDLRMGVENGFDSYRRKLPKKRVTQPRPAA
jgi:transposase